MEIEDHFLGACIHVALKHWKSSLTTRVHLLEYFTTSCSLLTRCRRACVWGPTSFVFSLKKKNILQMKRYNLKISHFKYSWTDLGSLNSISVYHGAYRTILQLDRYDAPWAPTLLYGYTHASLTSMQAAATTAGGRAVQEDIYVFTHCTYLPSRYRYGYLVVVGICTLWGAHWMQLISWSTYLLLIYLIVTNNEDFWG